MLPPPEATSIPARLQIPSKSPSSELRSRREISTSWGTFRQTTRNSQPSATSRSPPARITTRLPIARDTCSCHSSATYRNKERLLTADHIASHRYAHEDQSRPSLACCWN